MNPQQTPSPQAPPLGAPPQPGTSPAQPLPRPVQTPPEPPKKGRLKRLLRSKKFWALSLLVLLVCLIAAWFIQPSRIWLVNLAGAKTTLNISTITPGEGKQQAAKLKNVQIRVNERQFKTDIKGELRIADQPYGPVEVVAEKQGYAEARYKTTLDFDPFFHYFGGQAAKQADIDPRTTQLQLAAVGVPVSFKAVDWLSGQPLTSGEYLVGDIIVKPDDKGVVSFRAPSADTNNVTITSNLGADYLNKVFEISLNEKTQTQQTFVPSGKQYFLSRLEGALSVYSSNIDGSDRQVVTPGTGQEAGDTNLAISPSGRYGVLVSTREGFRDAGRYLQRRLYVINLSNKQLTKVDEGFGFQLFDWSGDKLIYNKLGNDEAASPQDATLRVLDAAAAKSSTIAAAHTFGRVAVGFNQAAFIQTTKVAGSETLSNTDAKVFDLRNNTLKNLGYNVLNLRQPGPDRVAFMTQTDQKWHEYNLNTSQSRETGQPNESASLAFLGMPSPDGTRQLLVDRIDGQFTLFARTLANGADKQLYASGGLMGPIRWLNNNVVTFRVVSSTETADYAVSLLGGQAKKIANISASDLPSGGWADPHVLRTY